MTTTHYQQEVQKGLAYEQEQRDKAARKKEATDQVHRKALERFYDGKASTYSDALKQVRELEPQLWAEYSL